MDYLDVAQEVVDNMLGYLGFVVTVEIDRENRTLNISSGDSNLLIGHHGDRLEELQYLANRIVQDRLPEAEKFRVDIDFYRASFEERMVEEAEHVAARVINTGQSAKLEPMNSYHRRIIHNHFKDHAEVKTWSPTDSARLKRITILPK
ncbi:MAG: single-stranded DNA-binding protein [Verrucomicrobiales bacterium]|nr:single-stranded DNA-binding protein [Verrucomicrobiales bacterium]